MSCVGTVVCGAFDEVCDLMSPVEKFVGDTSNWFGHAFKAIKIAPQYMPDSMVTEKGKNAFDQFGTLAGVFVDLPDLLGDIEELAGDVMALAGRIFSQDAWINFACSARNVTSGLVHSIVDLGLGSLVPLAESAEAWLTMTDGTNMILSGKNAGMKMAPYVCKMGLAVGVLSLGFFSIAGTLTGAQMLYLSTATAGCGLAKDIAEI